jgi:sugar transferase (PEP-CTERM/EpsH1 system associated)
MRIRIMHIIDTLLGMGGMEKGVINLVNRMDPGRFEHVICVLRSLGTLANQIRPERASVVCVGENGSGRRFQAGTLATHIRKVQPDVVHCRNWGTIEAVFAGRCVGIPGVVYSEHGMESSARAEPLRRRCIRRVAFQIADRVLSVSCALRDYHARNTGFPPGKISVIHNGVDTELYRGRPCARALARSKYGLAPDELCVGTVGRLEPVKDLLTLLRAAGAFPASLEWRILIAGDGTQFPVIQEYLQARPALQNRVLLLGEIEDVSEYLNALDIYALPSLYEGISNSLLEAMATGLPVVATDVGGNSEVVVDGESGLLFPVGDSAALAERLSILSRGDAREHFGREALRRVREAFSMEAMVRQYTRLYNSVAF